MRFLIILIFNYMILSMAIAQNKKILTPECNELFKFKHQYSEDNIIANTVLMKKYKDLSGLCSGLGKEFWKQEFIEKSSLWNVTSSQIQALLKFNEEFVRAIQVELTLM